MRVILWAAILLLALAPPAKATTVVLAWTPTATAFGADSLTHTLDEDRYWSICKINVVGSVFWAAAGATANPAMNFSLEDIAGKTLSGEDSLDARISAFDAALTPKLAEVADAIRTENPDWYYRNAEGLALTRVIFEEFRDGVNRLRLREYFTRENKLLNRVDVTVTGTDCPGAMCQDFRVFMLGQQAFARKVVDDDAMWRDAGLTEGVRRAIEAEATHNPEHVGPPIAVVEITKDGANWINRGACAAAKK
jgi:hypothetical protein